MKLSIGAIVLAGILIFAIGLPVGTAVNNYLQTGSFQLSASQPTVINTGTSPGPDGNCETNPSWVQTGVNLALPGSNVTPAGYGYIVNDQYAGDGYTTPVYGDRVDVLADPSGYLADTISTTVGCGANRLAFSFKEYANSTITIYNDAETGILTNAAAGGAVNETEKAAGATYNWKIRDIGSAYKYSGPRYLVVELSSDANVSKVTLDGQEAMTVSSGYTRSLNNGWVGAFKVEELAGATSDYYLLHVESAGSKIVTGAVYTSWFAEQEFIDANGELQSGAFDDSSAGQGAAKYQDVQYYNFLIA